MFAHYLTIALRTLRRAPVTALINVLTLALGLVSFVAAYAIVNYWDNSERHFANVDRTYVITASLALRNGSIATGTMPQTNELYDRYLPLEFPEFVAVAKANVWNREASITADGRGARVAAVAVDAEFLDIFDLPFIAGDRTTALRDPSGVLLSAPAAIRLFGTTDVLGETVTLGGNLIDTVVTGVVGPIPEPSHIGNSATSMLRFDLIASWDLYDRLRTAVNTPATPPPAAQQQAGDDAAPPAEAEPAEAAPPPQENENWLGGYCCTTYVMLEPGSSVTPDELNARLRDFVERRLTPEMLAMATVEVGAVPVSDMMVTALNAQILGSASSALSITTLLFGVAALVLFVACINYANLATARAMRRAREIGLRKAVGAQQGQIVFQHLFEAGVLTAAALVVAVLTVYLLAPLIKSAVDIDIRLGLFTGLGFWLFVTALLAGVTLLGGGYPAFMLSRVRPVEALRLGRMRAGPRFVSTLLVGTQFAAASLLVIAVIVMYTQNAELRRTGLGTLEDPYLVINNFGNVTGVDTELLWQEFERLPQVKGVTQMGSEPWSDNVNLNLLTRTQDPDEPTHTAFWNNVGYDFFEVFDMPVIAGRAFARDRNDLPPQNNDDLTIPRNIVIDRAFAAQLGFATPEEAVDATVFQPSQFGPSRPQQIIGVVESRPFYLRGFGATANGYSLGNGAGMVNQIVRLSAADVAGGLAAVEQAWQSLGPRVPLQRRFMDEMFEQSYRNFARINQAFTGLAAFAIGISLIGLFGMAMQTASRRVHEIGVRKSMGAQTWEVLGMLLYSFSKPVVVANLIAWPLAYFAAQAYLSIFIQRIELTPLPFLLSLAFVLAVAWAAVSQQALRAARVNPASVLRFE
jgi:putative ABC transport system permease protein